MELLVLERNCSQSHSPEPNLSDSSAWFESRRVSVGASQRHQMTTVKKSGDFWEKFIGSRITTVLTVSFISPGRRLRPSFLPANCLHSLL